MKPIMLLIFLIIFTLTTKASSKQPSSSQETGNNIDTGYTQNKVNNQVMASNEKQFVFQKKHERKEIPKEKTRQQSFWHKVKIGLSALAVIGTLLIFAYIAGIAGVFLIVPII